VIADGAVGDELVERFRTITDRLQSLKLETDEVSQSTNCPQLLATQGTYLGAFLLMTVVKCDMTLPACDN